jgi:hypothetical protein
MEDPTKEKKGPRLGQQIITEGTEFIRLPRSGERCPVSGLSRSAMINLVVPNVANGGKAVVKSKVLKSKPGNLKGVRLIQKESLLQFLKGKGQ